MLACGSAYRNSPHSGATELHWCKNEEALCVCAEEAGSTFYETSDSFLREAYPGFVRRIPHLALICSFKAIGSVHLQLEIQAPLLWPP